VLAVPDPGPTFPYVQAMWHYARGVAQAELGDVGAARDEGARIMTLKGTSDFQGLIDGGVPAPDLLDIALHVLAGRVFLRQNDPDRAAAEYRAAVALQDTLPYMEPPYWYYPARQTLGAIQLQQGQADAAVKTFNEALAETPRNGWALWGLLQAQLAADQNPVATRAALEKAWLGSDDLLTLDRL
jgi:tetratricopeptide (TPR) repeat protein